MHNSHSRLPVISGPSPPPKVHQMENDQSGKMDFQSQSENAVGGMQKRVAVHEDDDDDNSAYFNSMPPGIRFCPTDDELINYYLQKKIMKEPLPINRIRDVQLYKHNPEYLAENYHSYGENEWYFFTPRDRKYKNGDRPNRAAGNGYWKATGADKKIYSNDDLVGFRKALVFYIGKAPKGDKSDWIMHEFRVVRSPPSIRAPDDMTLDNCVLCKMYQKSEKSEAQDTEIEAKDVNTRTETSDHSDVGDENHVPASTGYNNSDSSRMLCSYGEGMDNCMGLINPSGWSESGHSLQYNLPPLLSEPNQMLPSNYPYQSNMSFGYGDPDNSLLQQPISFVPPTHFMESNYQQTGYVYNDYWGFKQEDSNMLPQYDFKQEDYNMLPQYDFYNRNCLDPLNFLSDDINLPNATDISPVLRDKSSFTNKNADEENANDKDKSSFTNKKVDDKNANVSG